MITNALQLKAFTTIASALPFSVDPAKVTVEPGLSYTKSVIKAHDYAAGVMAAYGLVAEHVGRLRGLPAQTMTLDRRLCGLLLNSAQMHYLNGHSTLIETWPIGPDNGTYRTRDDRHVTIIGLFPHLRDAILDRLQCSNSAGSIQAAIEKRTAQEIEDEFAAARLPAGVMRSPEEWAAHPQGAATISRAAIDIESRGSARHRLLGKAHRRPLEGVRVLELTHLVAGPTIGKLLAELGAEVINCQPPVGDWVYPLWVDVNWGKRNVLLDLKGRFGKARFTELLAEADVLVSSLAPGSLDRLGFGEAALQELNPNLVLATASFAPSGTPWAERKGFEQIAQSVTGIMHLTSGGLPEPSLISVLINDYLTGYLGAIGTIAALAEREEKGGFWKVNASLAKCATMATAILDPAGETEAYAPVTMRDLVDYAIDQPSPMGVFTRLRPAVAFSHVPAMHLVPTSLPGTSSDLTGWGHSADAGLLRDLPHMPSRLARENLIRNFISSFGIEDRGDGGGVLSLASKSLMQLALAARQ